MTAIICTALVCGSALAAWHMHLSRLPRLNDAAVAKLLADLAALEQRVGSLAAKMSFGNRT